jgi:hypothetical protein
MGKASVRGEGILGNYTYGNAYFVKDNFMSNMQLSEDLHSFNADKLKYFHEEASGNNVCNLGVNLEEALMVKLMSGERKNGF